ncbi:MAG: RING finger protein [Planctomycetota bacterium]
MERATAQRSCPFCHDSLKEEDAIWECPQCRTTHHIECAKDHRHCAVFACAGTPPAVLEAPIDMAQAQFVTAQEDHSEITRLRTPEIVWASFAVRLATGTFLAVHTAARLRDDPTSILDGSFVPIFVGAGFAVSPLREVLRIRECGYEKRLGHKAYLVSLGVAMLVLVGMSLFCAAFPHAHRSLALWMIAAFVVEVVWPAERG